jgi:hypothetical protein
MIDSDWLIHGLAHPEQNERERLSQQMLGWAEEGRARRSNTDPKKSSGRPDIVTNPDHICEDHKSDDSRIMSMSSRIGHFACVDISKRLFSALFRYGSY